jgi:hypothetical protein
VHVDVGREHVAAALDGSVTDLIGEVRRVKALALQAALHVGDREDDGVDVAATDTIKEFVARKTTWG